MQRAERRQRELQADSWKPKWFASQTEDVKLLPGRCRAHGGRSRAHGGSIGANGGSRALGGRCRAHGDSSKVHGDRSKVDAAGIRGLRSGAGAGSSGEWARVRRWR